MNPSQTTKTCGNANKINAKETIVPTLNKYPIEEMIDTLLIIPTRKLATTIMIPDVRIVVIDFPDAFAILVSGSLFLLSSRYLEV